MADPVQIFDDDQKTLTLEAVIPVKDYEGKDAALFEFTYTNKTSDGKMPLTEFFMTIYQGGMSLESAILMDAQYSDIVGASLKQVRDGASLLYGVAYNLNDTTSDLEMEISDSIIGGNTQKFTIPMTGDADRNAETAGESTEEVDWEAKYNELLEQYNLLEKKYNELVAVVEAQG